MGFLETTVVVYLRLLYYPNGFQFPLAPMEPAVYLIEVVREVATLIMLAGVAFLAGRSFLQRFSSFLISFAVWDIFYYIFLKVLVDWPESLLTWDILFLVPMPWIGPVLAPCIASVTMILLACVLIHGEKQNTSFSINLREWLLLTGGSVILLVSWTRDYLVQGHGRLSEEFFSSYVPGEYNWWIFGLGEFLLLSAVYSLYKRP